MFIGSTKTVFIAFIFALHSSVGLAQVTGLMKNPDLSPGSVSVRDPLSDAILRKVELGNSGSQTVLSRMRSLRDDHLQKQKDIERERMASAPGVITALEVQKAREMEEVRKGLFCRGCNKTRSQIEAEGKNWQQELDQFSGGVPVGASPMEIAEKERVWNQKILRAKQVQSAALQRKDRLTLEADKICEEIEWSVFAWRDAMRREDDARAKNYQNRLNSFKQEMAETRGAIVQKKSQIIAEQKRGKKANSELLSDYNEALNRELSHLSNIAIRAGEEFAKRKAQDEAFSESVSQGKSEMRSLLTQVGGRAILNPELGRMSLKVPLLSMSTGGEMIGLSANLGVLRSTIAASCEWLRSECKLNVSMSYSVPFVGSGSFGMEQKTSYGVDGVSQTVSPTIELKIGPLNLMKKKQ
jgi:hypothetical protein